MCDVLDLEKGTGSWGVNVYRGGGGGGGSEIPKKQLGEKYDRGSVAIASSSGIEEE